MRDKERAREREEEEEEEEEARQTQLLFDHLDLRWFKIHRYNRAKGRDGLLYGFVYIPLRLLLYLLLQQRGGLGHFHTYRCGLSVYPNKQKK